MTGTDASQLSFMYSVFTKQMLNFVPELMKYCGSEISICNKKMQQTINHHLISTFVMCSPLVSSNVVSTADISCELPVDFLHIFLVLDFTTLVFTECFFAFVWYDTLVVLLLLPCFFMLSILMNSP